MVGFSGCKDSTLVAPLIFKAVRTIPADERTEEIHIFCTDMRVKIPADVETVEGTWAKRQYAHDFQAERQRIFSHDKRTQHIASG